MISSPIKENRLGLSYSSLCYVQRMRPVPFDAINCTGLLEIVIG